MEAAGLQKALSFRLSALSFFVFLRLPVSKKP